MKQILILCTSIFLGVNLKAQEAKSNSHRNFPLIISVQFHSLSLPFKNLKSNFSNFGIGLGTEVSHNGGQNWVQQLNVGWYRNASIGNGLFFNTQAVWRPTIVNNFYTELKAGIGYHYSFRPVESYKQENGTWISVGRKGKGMFSVPVGISAGYSKYQAGTYISPFISYQLLLLKGYNTDIPLVPETLIQAGTRIHF
jgi:hypothetical protein